MSSGGGGVPDDVGGGLTTRSATSLLDYDFGIMSALTHRGKKLIFNSLCDSCDIFRTYGFDLSNF